MKIVGKIFAVLFCIVYFFGLTLLMTASFATNLLSGNYYADVLKSVDLDEVKALDIGDVFNGIEISEEASVQDVLVQNLTKAGVEEKTAIAIIENNEIREIIGNFIGDYVNYNAGTGDAPTINRKDVETVLNNPDVIKAIGERPTEEDIDKIYDQLNDLTKEIIEGGAERGNNERNNNVNPNF